MLILTRADVESLLNLDRLVDAVATAMADLSAGAASVPPRLAAMVDRVGGLLAAMPAYLPSAAVLETKLVSLFPGNAGSEIPTHQAVIVCFDPATGSPVALMDAEYITATRTAAGSALATRLLARADAQVLSVLGTGVQARAHARAVTRVRSFVRLRVAGRDAHGARSVAEELSAELSIEAEGVGSYAEAMDGADVVCACTHSPEPVVRREWLGPGTHINSVGLNGAGREVDAATVREAFVVIESRASALAPFPAGANDLTWPIRDGEITEDHLTEIGSLVSGTVAIPPPGERITLYKSVGVGVQDAAAAALVLEAARRQGVGTDIPL